MTYLVQSGTVRPASDADDTSIYSSHRDPITVGSMLEEDFRGISEWIDANGMKMNVAKTLLMVMCGHKKKHLEDKAQVCIGEAILPKQDSVKYLGVTVDKQLSWKLHVANIRRVCLGKVHMLMCFAMCMFCVVCIR